MLSRVGNVVLTSSHRISNRAARKWRQIHPQAYCTTKNTICATQYLLLFSCFGLTHAIESESGFAKPNKRKIANAICSFVARPPPNNDKTFCKNKRIFYCSRKVITYEKMNEIRKQTFSQRAVSQDCGITFVGKKMYFCPLVAS